MVQILEQMPKKYFEDFKIIQDEESDTKSEVFSLLSSNGEEEESSDSESNTENLMVISENSLPNIIQINNKWMKRIIYDPPLDPCMEFEYPSWEEIPTPQIDAKVLLESAKPFTSKHSIYIETRVSVRGYHRYTLNAYVDTGAGFNMMLKHALPDHMWKKAPIPLEAVMANTNTSLLEYVAHNIHIFISGKEFLIDKVWQTDIKGQPDLLLGNNFIQTYEPFVQTKNTIQFTLPNGLPVTVDKIRDAYAHAFDPAFLDSFKKPPSECPVEKPGGPSILFKTPMRPMLTNYEEIQLSVYLSKKFVKVLAYSKHSPSLVSQCDNWSALRFHLRPDPEKGTLPLGAWSKILREDYKDSRRGGIDGDFDEEEEADGRIPHEFLARQLASSASSSVPMAQNPVMDDDERRGGIGLRRREEARRRRCFTGIEQTTPLSFFFQSATGIFRQWRNSSNKPLVFAFLAISEFN
ncbi:hypothetical protein MRB53_013531 [Persea americana]|uniref:Uncharacterized protein n=1 Tax=Persea americana TaxID=3435 RepID=A0ACC2K8C5_PERAE|nr:hypothetical protein MRB53_013531 [Persea americana]